jgi:hypothetical protein
MRQHKSYIHTKGKRYWRELIDKLTNITLGKQIYILKMHNIQIARKILNAKTKQKKKRNTTLQNVNIRVWKYISPKGESAWKETEGGGVWEYRYRLRVLAVR